MRDISRLQSIVYNGLMEARFKPEKNLLEILDETIDWIHDDHFVQEYDISTSKEKPHCYGKPNELCSSSHPETDEDCEYLKECMEIFHNSLRRSNLYKGDA